MRRWLLPALMITLLFSGCGRRAPERKLTELRQALRAAEEIRASAELAANIGDEVFSCTLDCTAQPERVTVEVKAPEAVAGVRAVYGPDGTTLEYETLALALTAPDEAALSPMNALPRLITALREASVLRGWTEWEGEKTLFVREYYISDDTTLSVWFDAGTGQPVHGEFAVGGAVALRCRLLSFDWTPKQKG